MVNLKEKAEHWRGILKECEENSLYIVIGCGVSLSIEGEIMFISEKTVRLMDGDGYEHACYLWDIREVSY